MNIETLSAIADQRLQTTTGNLRSFREHHLGLFKTNGLKETVLDSYKFTNLERFFENLSHGPRESAVDLHSEKISFPTIYFVDGVHVETEKLPEGLEVLKIKDHFEELKTYFQETNALTNLHHGLMEDGLFIRVAKGQDIKTPIRILNLVHKSGINALTHLIVAGPHSKVTLLEENRGSKESQANLSETYLMAQAGATIEHVKIDHGGSESLLHGSVFAEVGKDATLRSLLIHGSGKLNRSNLTLNLNAPGANGESYSLYLTEGTEHSDLSTVIHHRAPDTTSNQIAKGILDGDSKGIFTGKIHIHPKAQRVASGQLNKNLLLSKKAQAHSQPQLEIFADDVKCSHGSTTGQLSDDELFYFQARGIPMDLARTILAHGFGLEIVQKMTNEAARKYVSALVMDKLTHKFHLGGPK